MEAAEEFIAKKSAQWERDRDRAFETKDIGRRLSRRPWNFGDGVPGVIVT